MERQLHRLFSAVGACPVLTRHPDKTGGTDVIEREIDYHEDMKQARSEQSQPCVAQAFVGIDRQVGDAERHQRVVALEACVA